MTIPAKRRSVKKVVFLAVMQAGVILAFAASAGYLASQVPKVVGAARYYTSVGSKQTDRKLDEASDSASRLEEELIQAARAGTISAEEFQTRYDQLKTAQSNRDRAFDDYKPAK